MLKQYYFIFLIITLTSTDKIFAQDVFTKTLPGNIKICTFSKPKDNGVDYSLSSHTIQTKTSSTTRVDSNPTFTEINPSGFKGVYFSPTQWIDYDNDHDLDFIISGSSDNDISVITTTLYQNNGDDLFTEVIGTGIPVIFQGTISWADYDNDGDLDIFYSGLEPEYPYLKISGLLKNNGSLPFEAVPFEFTPLYNGASQWGDLDNDGDMDLVFSGYEFSTSASSKTFIYSNDGFDQFTKIDTGIKFNNFGSLNLIDVDNDNDLDLYVTDNNHIYINEGYLSFSETSIFLIDYHNSASDWADYDEDGDLDLIITGLSYGIYVTEIYKNQGDLTFEPIGLGLPGAANGDIKWADYDNDGDYDFILSGQNNTEPITKIYTNEGSEIFSELLGEILPQLYSTSIDWADYDLDGDLDLLFSGTNQIGIYTKIFKNDIVAKNTAPEIPSNLHTTLDHNSVTLNWDSVSDGQSATAVIKYNLYIGSQPGTADVFSPHAILNDGWNTGVDQINGSLNEQWVLKKLPIGTYYWAVQAIDPGLMTSNFSQEGSFEVTMLSPPRNPEQLNSNAVSSTEVVLSWIDKSDDEDNFHIERSDTGLSGTYISIANLESDITFYKDSVLTPNTQYYYRIYASNEWGNSLITDSTSVTTPSTDAPSQLTATSNNNKVILAWTENAIDEVNVIVERSNQLEMGYVEAGRLVSNSTSYTDILVEHNTTYYYRIGVIDTLGNKIYSDYIKVVTPAIYKYTDIEAFENISSGSVSWADYDNDGDMDALISCRLFKNNGDKTFTQIFYAASPNIISQDAQCVWGDFNNDQLTDFLIFDGSCQIRVAKNNGNDHFITYYESTGVCKWVPIGVFDFNNDGYLDIFSTHHTEDNQLLINQQGESFTPLSSGVILTRSENGYVYDMAFGDIDNNGYQDVIVAVGNDENMIYMNNGDGTFYLQILGDFINDTSANFTISLGDFDNDGDLDLFSSSTNNNTTSTVYSNDGNGVFTILPSINFFNMKSATSSSWVDYDLDGDLDLIIIKSLNKNSYLFQNNGSSGFKEIYLGEISKEQGVGNACSFVDYDLDGDLDFYQAVYQDGYDLFMENNGNSNNWLNIRLKGYKTNYSAIGTKVKIKANGKWQYREVLSRTGHNSQNSMNQVFGLKDIALIDSIVVQWPLSPNEQIFTNVNSNQFLIINEAEMYPPSSLSSFTSQALSKDTIELVWSSSLTNNELGFILEQSVNDSLNYNVIDTIPQNIRSFYNVQLNPNTTYYYRIKGFNNSGESVYSKTSATTIPLPPEAPSELLVSLSENLKVSLVWLDNSNSEEGFIIEKSQDDNTSFQLLTSLPKNVLTYSYNESSPPATLNNIYRIKAFNEGGESAYSNEYSLLITSTEDLLNLNTNIYPNPVSNVLNINFTHKSTGMVEIKVRSLSGKVIKKKQQFKYGNTLESSLNINDLPHGLFILDVLIDYESVIKQRFIKQ